MDEAKPQCSGKGTDGREEYDLALHVAGLFIVLITSCLGCGFPVAAKKFTWLKIPPKVFFACKHFGTGVLIATAFVHLLPTVFGSLGNPCLPDLFTKDYPALPGVVIMAALFLVFCVEMWLNSKTGGHSHGGPTGDGITGFGHTATQLHAPTTIHTRRCMQQNPVARHQKGPDMGFDRMPSGKGSIDGRTLNNVSTCDDEEKLDKLSTMPVWFVAFYEQYVRQHTEVMDALQREPGNAKIPDEEKAQVTVSEYAVDEGDESVDPAVLRKMSANITMLEGGILFHSVFVGMTVSITTESFVILLVAISFHQLFEGLGLGSRIAAVPYPTTSVRPWVLVLAFGTTAPIGQAIGLLTRNTYDPEGAFGLILVGVFNAISSGLLIYAALVDLLAEDFLSKEADELMSGRDKARAFGWLLLGAFGMSVVGAFA